MPVATTRTQSGEATRRSASGRGIASTKAESLLLASVWPRLAVAAVLSALLWLCFRWAVA
ncbi:hypothetical protein SAMN05444370_1177 [Rubrimonas cliftonensis]|uniref:Uncharacterized protein n=1 Tax=Rubrimonas cliftonensis TaxID=89524 RepID=A0A1H4EZN6_9RHOB|nr:hypothetical protein SAMN05444370_1177 [Rubrimonas cliftonensis]